MSQKRARGETVGAEATVGTVDADFFESLAQNSPDPIFSVGTDGEVRYANPSIRQVLGYEPEALVGESAEVLVPDRFQEKFTQLAKAYLETGKQTINWDGAELLALTADGEELPVSVSIVEHHGDGDRVFSAVLRDISDQIERREELKAEAKRMEEFAGTVARDVRDPLNAAEATVSLLEAETDSDRIEELRGHHDRIDDVIEDALTLTSHDGAADTEAVALSDVAMEAWSKVSDAETNFRLAGDPGLVEADADQLRTLLENLLTNVAKHGGERARLGALDEGEGFFVADDGPGIPVDERDAAFDYGYSDSGTGLGLAIVERIAEAHDWTVSVTESEEGGARFDIRTDGAAQ